MDNIPQYSSESQPSPDINKKGSIFPAILAFIAFLIALGAIGISIYQQTQIIALQNQLSQLNSATIVPTATSQPTPITSFEGYDIETPNMKARDTKRRADLFSITNAIYQYAAEHNGKFPGTNGEDNFPTTLTCIGQTAECFDLGNAGGVNVIVPTYIASIPKDPSNGTDLDTKYKVYYDSNIGRIIVSAQGELEPEITVTR